MSENRAWNFSVFKRLVAYTKPYRGYLWFAVVCTIILAFLGPLRPLIIKTMVDRYMVITKDANQLFFWTMMIIGILIIEGILQFLSTYYSNVLAQSIIIDLRAKLFKHILAFKMRYFDKTSIGVLVTRLVSDLEAITEVFSAGLMNIAGDLIMLLFTIIMMTAINWEFTLYVLIPIPLLVITTRIFARAMNRSFQLERVQVARLNSFVQERITGMSLVQLFNRQKHESESFKTINAGHRQAHIDAIWANSIFFPVVEILSSLSVAFLYVIVIANIQNGSSEHIMLTMGEITAFTLWIYMLYRPIRQLAERFNILQRGVVRAERVFDVLDHEEHIQKMGTVTNCDFNRDIEFKNVFFAYNDDEWVLKNINLKIPRGSTTAFVGATGAGKSSIVNLLGRFYEFTEGDITIGEHSINDIELEYLRKNIAIVWQDVFLFSDSIHNNITLNDPSISREQVIEAAKVVGAHEFIMRLPENYDYQVGERGGVLSVGQRQLLSFIRAYVYNPRILILDEATSSVDNESEALIQRATEKLTEGRTSIVIAHRLSTVQKATNIVVLDHGEIKEQGTHFELLEQKGYYKKLFDLQFVE